MAETSTKPSEVADEAPETVRGGAGIHGPIHDQALPIGLLVNCPQPGPNLCANPFIASGTVNPSSCLLDARIVIPNGALPGTPLPRPMGHPEQWSFSFAANPPPLVECTFVINARNGNGQTKQVVVPFNCGGPPPPPPPPPM
jgi:hypothetical protein